MKKHFRLIALATMAIAMICLAGCKKENNDPAEDEGPAIATITFSNDTTNVNVNQNGYFHFKNRVVWTYPEFHPVIEIQVDGKAVKSENVTYPMTKTFEVECPKGKRVEVYYRLNPNPGFDTTDGAKYDVPNYLKLKADSRYTGETATVIGMKASRLLDRFERPFGSL